MQLLTRTWRSQPGRFFCIATKAHDGTWKDHFFGRSKFKDIPAFLEQHKDKDLYWCPHGFNKPRRLKKHAEIPHLLWADLDETNPRDLSDLMPTIAWETSPGRYAALWHIDAYMTEDVNRRLTYHLKADPGGWDLTQVLRIPGTKNYKYVSTPRVRMLWSDGPVYALASIEKRLPKERKTQDVDVATGLYRKYEKQMSSFVRRQLLRGKPVEGKRSEVLWRLVHELIECGCTRDEAFELLRVSPWNKFSKRRNGDEQLRRELDKALDQHLLVEDDESNSVRYGEEDDSPDDGEEYRYLSRSMAEVEAENIDWIWYPYLARGEVTILEGDPGLGKSYLAQMIAAGICDGAQLPSVKKLPGVQGRVAYFDIENSSGTVTKKRLVTNGCVNLQHFYQEEQPFSIDDEEHTARVYQAIEALKPTLVVFDTLNTYIGGADTHKASETQQAFKRFVDIARRFDCSVMVLRHLTKSSKERALYRGQGSISFTGLARVVLTVGCSPDDDDTRVMAVTKINVTRAPKALTFTIEALPDTLKEQDRSRFVWGDFVDLTADEIVAARPNDAREKNGEHDDAVTWLRDQLQDGSQTFDSLKRKAEQRSVSVKALYRAADELGVVKSMQGFGKGKTSTWTLPDA
jgi:archaellum biogenesis ATPase FlaH